MPILVVGGGIQLGPNVFREVRNWFLQPGAPPDPQAKPTFSGVAWLYDGIQLPTEPPQASPA